MSDDTDSRCVGLCSGCNVRIRATWSTIDSVRSDAGWLVVGRDVYCPACIPAGIARNPDFLIVGKWVAPWPSSMDRDTWQRIFDEGVKRLD